MAETQSKFAPLPGYTRTSINRAGERLKHWWLDEDAEASEAIVEAFEAMITFRESFQVPLKKTVTGLRSMVRSECPKLKLPGARVPVAQRLKRREQIINKLARLESMRLWTMGDIGGCRAVLPSRQQVDGVLRRIRKEWDVHGRIRDRRDEPAESGYRAVHVIVIRDGRMIEIQLRDPKEHEWAVVVERTGARLGLGLKEGEGPEDLKEYFRLASLGMYMERMSQQPDPSFVRSFDAARQRAIPYFRRS
jgi:(p)ppGpp synthase/HD superfamily hydrolase